MPSFALPNIRPLAGSDNKRKANNFEHGGHDGQVVRLALHFLYALTESVLPCHEFDTCENMARLVKRAARTASASTAPPSLLRAAQDADGREGGASNKMRFMDLLESDFGEELALFVDQMAQNGLQEQPTLDAIESNLIGIQSVRPSFEACTFLRLPTNCCVLKPKRSTIRKLLVPEETLLFMRQCGLPTCGLEHTPASKRHLFSRRLRT